MPVIAVAGAVASVAVAGSAVAATAGGILAISAVTAFEVVAAVGATLGAIGAITKNKTLTMVGGAIGIVGAVGGVASAAGLLGEAAASGGPIFGAAPASSTADAAASTTSAFGGAASDASSAGTYGSTAGEFGSGTVGAADAASSNMIPFVADGLPPGQTDLTTLSSVADKATDPARALADVTPTSASSTVDPAKDLASMTDPSKGLINQPPGGVIDTPPAPPNMLGTTDPATGQNTTMAVDPVKGIVSLPDSGSSSGVFGNILKFANNNKTLISGAMTVGGKLLEGLTSETTPAQVAALQAQAAANDAAAQLTNQQRQNLAMPKAVASSTPVTGTPAALVPPRGLINQPQLAPVTGAV